MNREICGRCGDWIGHGRSHYCLGPLTKSITDKPIITKATIQPCPGCAATNQVQVERIATLEALLAEWEGGMYDGPDFLRRVRLTLYGKAGLAVVTHNA